MVALGRKAQVASLVNARKKAEKRKENTLKRAEKRKRDETVNEDEPDAKKTKKASARVIAFTQRDFDHVKRLFHTAIVHFGNVNITGLFAAYDCMACPVVIYPIFTEYFDKKKQSIYKRKFILGVGRASSVFTGITQAFADLYPDLPVNRVYDWELMKWNKRAYKAPTVNTAVDPGVLSQQLYSSKSFGGTKHLLTVKVIDELSSARKMECAIEVSKYINKFVDARVRRDLSPDGVTNTLSFEEVRKAYAEAEAKQADEKTLEAEVSEKVASSDLIEEAFKRMKDNAEVSGSESESDSDSDN
jgi:hypothetical protein